MYITVASILSYKKEPFIPTDSLIFKVLNISISWIIAKQ